MPIQYLIEHFLTDLLQLSGLPHKPAAALYQVVQ